MQLVAAVTVRLMSTMVAPLQAATTPWIPHTGACHGMEDGQHAWAADRGRWHGGCERRSPAGQERFRDQDGENSGLGDVTGEPPTLRHKSKQLKGH